MFLMLSGAVVTSLSGVVYPPITETTSTLTNSTSEIEETDLLPIYVPIMVSFLMPITCAFFTVFIRYSFNTLQVTANAWTFGYSFIFNLVIVIAGIIKFSVDPDYFSTKFFILGFICSIFSTLGCLFSQFSLATGAPLGPISAVSNTQMVVLTLISAVATSVMPNWM